MSKSDVTRGGATFLGVPGGRLLRIGRGYMI